MIQSSLRRIRELKPLVHCITNIVTINDCANALLACGASPVMAEDPREAAEMTAVSQALVLNLGTLSDRKLEAMQLAGKRANKVGIPVVLDPVGVGASTFRREAAAILLKEVRVDILRGNLSEVMSVTIGKGRALGVEAGPADVISEENLIQWAEHIQSWAKRLGAVIAVTGALDVMSDGEQVVVCRNGHPDMRRISGTGCMLSAVMGAHAAVRTGEMLEAAVSATCVMGLCGENAWEHSVKSGGIAGTAGMKTLLIDSLSWAEEVVLKGEARYGHIEFQRTGASALCADKGWLL